ncbi:unnamed protein product [Orchesella dallaii]|uniref:Carboxylic ester hydrolase n=1 Tax=Orchesella dallaii TaxID=48710 RepID=A0ABP1R987_9HEXA
MNFPFIFSLLLAFFGVVAGQVVNTTLGAVQGFTSTSRNGRNFSTFLGIPYATTNRRFEAPEPAEGWGWTVKNASSYGNICPQFSYSATNSTGDEDCLTVNVFTPVNSTSTGVLLPVLVYIHGGYFMVLSGSNYAPRYFMDHNVVMVTFNYRLGAFGFLSTQDENAPGNAGMKDQVLALKWVQNNIAYFGGDPSRVTIYGESAGAAAVQYHLLSPMSQGLFSAAISGSGTAFKVLSLQLEPLQTAQKLAEEVGCGTTIGNNTEMIECLSSVDASVIAAQSYEFLEIVKDPLRIYCPSIEINRTSSEAFLTRHPYEMLTEGLQKPVPWMVGVNSAEGLIVTSGIYASEEWTQEMNLNWNNLAPQFLVYSDNNTNLTNSINEIYLNMSISDNIDFKTDLQGFTNIFTDRLYIHASLEAVKIQGTIAPVLLYYNDYTTESNYLGIGTSHGEELALLFSPPDFSLPIIEGHPDYEQSKIMVDLWAQFVIDPYNVKFGDTLWRPVDPAESQLTCLNLRNPSKGDQGVGILPDEIVERIEFWNSNSVPPYQVSY